jgi:C4-dicarboxylate-specific signal transduction histidine kinase
VQHPQSDLEKRLLEKLADCQRLALLGRLSANLTHEINNHLTGVSGYVQLLLGQERAQAVEKELAKVNFSANECKKMILDFKRFARFSAPEKEYNSLNAIIKQVLDLYRRPFSKKDLQIAEEYSVDLPVIELDAAALEQVFLNVVQNAFEALQETGGRLTVRTEFVQEHLLATFEDDGPGFSAEALGNLFNPFFSTKRHLHCAGLGLATAKVLMNGLGGEITVEPLLKSGARVKIDLPLADSDQKHGKE